MRQPAGRGWCQLQFIQTPNFSHHVACQPPEKSLPGWGGGGGPDETQIKDQKVCAVPHIQRMQCLVTLADVGGKVCKLVFQEYSSQDWDQSSNSSLLKCCARQKEIPSSASPLSWLYFFFGCVLRWGEIVCLLPSQWWLNVWKVSRVINSCLRQLNACSVNCVLCELLPQLWNSSYCKKNK